MAEYVDLSERVTATFYSDEYGEWTQQTVTIADVLDSVCDDYTVLPSAQPESKWIPWWHKYPDNNRFVLVCNDDGRMAIAQYIGHEADAYHPWQIAYCPYDVDVWEEDEYGKIVAWMDLPKPYRESGNDKRGSLSTFERLQSRILQWEYGQNTTTQLRSDTGDN